MTLLALYVIAYPTVQTRELIMFMDALAPEFGPFRESTLNQYVRAMRFTRKRVRHIAAERSDVARQKTRKAKAMRRGSRRPQKSPLSCAWYFAALSTSLLPRY